MLFRSGIVLIEPRSKEVLALKEIIQPEHFSLEGHRAIATAIAQLDRAEIMADMRTVFMHLKKTGKLDVVIGGAHYLAHLTSQVSSVGNIEYYYRCLIELWMKRELIALANNIVSAAMDETSDVFAILESTYATLKKIDPTQPETETL